MEPKFEYVYGFATTSDQVDAEEKVAIIIAYFVGLILTEIEAFSEANNVDMSEYDIQSWIDSYTAYLYEILMGMRQRIQEKQNELQYEYGNDYIPYLREYFVQQYNRVLYSELVDAKQLGQIIVSTALQTKALEQGINMQVYKTWRAFPDCCPICAALAGTTIPITEPFLVNGQRVDVGNGKTFIYDYVDRYVAFAHPNDRCWIELSIEYN